MAARLAVRTEIRMTITKFAKTPPINRQTKLLCFDLEANGLHGPVFAVGAVVMDRSGKAHEEFTARCDIDGEIDPWVKENVLPAITDMPMTHKNYKELREAFWSWYVVNEPKSDYVLVSNGYPVEYRFLIQCQEDSLDERYWQHPFPILDLTSLMVQAKADGARMVRQIAMSSDLSRHHPLHDAIMTAKAAFKVLL